MMVKALPISERPKTRKDCIDGPRPCPWVSCRYHLLVDIAEDGRLKQNQPFDEHDEESVAEALYNMTETCALDVVADNRDGLSHERVGSMFGVSKMQAHRDEASAVAELIGYEFDDEREHPEDFYIRYSNMGADELAEVAQMLRTKGKTK